MAKQSTKIAPPKVKDCVVEAAMAGGSGGGIGGGVSGKAIEQAMSEATMKALEDGITDSGEVLKLKLAARERIKDEHRKAAAKAAKTG